MLVVLAAVAPVALLLFVYTVEVVAGLRLLAVAAVAETMPRTAILIPAHNEAAGIGATLAALAIPPGGPVEVLVVADNCTDDTAARARAAGARVVERHDPAHRSKGYALAFGRDALAADPPECIVVLDADCAMPAGSLALLARHCVASGRPAQSCNLLRPDLAAPPTEQVSTFAFLVKNLVRQRGTMRLGGIAVLTGTGMAVPWTALAQAPLASGDLAEDLALGVWLAQHGWPAAFLPTARTWSDPATGADLIVQRSRWEHGFAATARRRALPLLAEGIARRDRGLAWLGLHLLVPPLALLGAAGGAATLVALVAALLGAGWAPVALVAAALAGAVAATMLAWRAEGRGFVSARALAQVPRYVAAKLPIYRRGRPTAWTRSRRADEPER